MRMAAVNPVFHSLLMTYSQLPEPVALLTELLALLATDDVEDAEEDEGTLLELLTLDAEPPTTPYGAGCEAQVLVAIQLVLFSQPQPLWVVPHSGYKVPYQLHC